MLASDVISRARETLLDPDGVRWTDDQLVGWLGDAQRAVAELRPAASAKTSVVTMTANTTKQTLPADGFVLFDVRRNMGADGATPGAPILECDLDTLRAFDTTWHSATGETVIHNFGYNKDEDPYTYWVSPRPHATTVVQVEILYGEVWADPSSTAATLDLGTEYLAALSEFLVSKAFSVDTDLSDPEKAQAHMTAFTTMIGAFSG